MFISKKLWITHQMILHVEVYQKPRAKCSLRVFPEDPLSYLAPKGT